MKKPFILVFTMLFILLSCSTEPEISFTVKNQKIADIDDRLFGQFLEKPSWHGELGPEAALIPGTHKLQPEALELMEKMNIPVLRFPGGTDVDITNWKDLIDMPGRTSGRPLFIGHRGDTVSNEFGYDEAGKLAEELNAELMLVVNFGDAYFERKNLPDAVMHETELLAYCLADTGQELPGDLEKWPLLRAENGHPDPYPVRYVQIANEPWVMDRKNIKQRGEMDEAVKEQYFKCLTAFIDTFSTVFPELEIIVDGNVEELTSPLKELFGDKIDYVAYHSYLPWGINHFLKDGEKYDQDSLTKEEIWKGWISVPQIDNNGLSVFNDRGIEIAENSGYPVAVTEWNWNGWWGGDSVDPDKLGSVLTKGIGAAGFVHALMRKGNSIDIGIQSMLVGNSWGITAVRVTPEASFTPYPLPTGQVTGFYSRNHGNELLGLEYENVPVYEQEFQINSIQPSEKVRLIDALVTRTGEKLFFHAINRDLNSQHEIVIDLHEFESSEISAIHKSLEGKFENSDPCQNKPLRYACLNEYEVKLKGKKIICLLPPRSVNILEIDL